MVTRRQVGLALVLLLAVGDRALAQTYEYVPGGTYRSLSPVTRPVSVGERRGVSLGDLELHPGISVDAGFNSNVFFEEDLEGPVSALALRIMPSLRLETPEPRMVRLTANAQLLWHLLLGDEQAVQEQSGFDILADFSAQLAPRDMFSMTVYDVLRREASSPTSPGFETRDTLYNEIGLALAFHPGGSDRTTRLGFTGSLSAGYAVQNWDANLGLDRDLVLTRLELKYFFLPQTAAMLRASWDLISYDQRERSFAEDIEDPLGVRQAFQGSLVNIDSSPVRLLGGVGGLLTQRITFRVEGGFSWGRYDEGESLAEYLARARLGVLLTPEVSLGAGWEAGFADSSFANYYRFQRFTADLNVPARDWIFGATVSYEQRSFATVDVPAVEFGGTNFNLYSTGDREDPILNATAFAAWNYMVWGRLVLYYDLTANFTDFVVTTGSSSGVGRPASSSSKFTQHEIFLGAEFEY